MEDYRETKEGKWRAENPAYYQRTVDFQVFLQGIGIAWHNPLANECTNDFGCCTNYGDYKARINRHGEYRTGGQYPDDRIPKLELIHRAWYVNKNKGRGMKVGMWESDKQRFLCVKGPKFGHYEVYEMPHFEDDDGSAIFEPIQRII